MSMIKIINASSLAPAVGAWLADSHYPRTLHVFYNVCNLINERGEVLSVVTPQIGKGPFNLVLDREVIFSGFLDMESQTIPYPDQLNLGDFMIRIRDAEVWNPQPDWDMLHTKKAYLVNQAEQLKLTNYQFTNPISSSLAIADLHAALTAARKLAGLGAGLTPAGDDFIMGALYATWILHPTRVAKVLAAEIANTAATLTTSLSAAWLRSAGKGEAGIVWHAFFEALLSGDPIQMQVAMDNILTIGETSGADALAGFLSTFVGFADRVKDD